MIQVFIIVLLVLVCILQCVLLYFSKKQYLSLQKTLNEINNDEFKYKNIFSMVEYYIRNYKEGENPFTVLRDITNLVYRTGEIQYEGKENRT